MIVEIESGVGVDERRTIFRFQIHQIVVALRVVGVLVVIAVVGTHRLRL